MKQAFERLKDEFRNNFRANKSFKSQIPNILTCSRGLAPFIIIPLILTGNITLGLIAGGLLASTDFFDGMLARKMHVESEFGRFIDPIVDKIFSLTLLITSAILNPIMILNIIPELAIAINNTRALNKGVQVKSSKVGKIKTWFLSANILLSFIPNINYITRIMASLITFEMQTATYMNYRKYNKENMIKDVKVDNNIIENTPDSEEKRLEKIMEFKRQIELLKNQKEMILNPTENVEEKILIKKPKR